MRVFLNALGCQSDATRFVAFLEPLRLLLIDLQYASLRSVSMSERDVLAERSRDAGAQFARLLRDSDDTRALLERFTALLEDGNESDAAEEILMNMFAGVETTTAVLGWIVDRLGVNPRAQDRLYLEMRDGDDVKTYRQCFIHETLRYFPPIPFVIRSVAARTDLNGEMLDRGKQIMVSIVGLHHDPRVWSSPQTFDAARPEFLKDTFERSSFIPFLQGPRTCGGIRLAGLEIAAGLDQLLKRFIITNQDAAIAFDYALAMRPRPSATMTMERR
jgi:cytochrome P450